MKQPGFGPPGFDFHDAHTAGAQRLNASGNCRSVGMAIPSGARIEYGRAGAMSAFLPSIVTELLICQ